MSATDTHAIASELLNFIEASPSPWHVVASVQSQLELAGFTALQEQERWALQAGGRYYVCRDGAALLAFCVGYDPVGSGFRIIGAHTDSPCLRIKTNGAHESGGLMRLGTEIYGSPILATFSDRDLLLAGRVFIRDPSQPEGVSAKLVSLPEHLLRLPNLPIHLNRNVNDEGLKIHKHTGLNLLAAVHENETTAAERLRTLLAEHCSCHADAVLSYELCAVDAQEPAFFGLDKEFFSVRQIDNVASCHAILQAMKSAAPQAFTQVMALFDHEEVGSESRSGAAGNFMESVLLRVITALSVEHDACARAVAASWHMSADMAHAFHPAHPECYDGLHHLKINGGVVLKMNSSQRYASSAAGEAFCVQLCERAQIPLQKYIHRADLACGTTIGPISAARLGIRTFDVGAPMWAMHSARESAGTYDCASYIKLMREFYQ